MLLLAFSDLGIPIAITRLAGIVLTILGVHGFSLVLLAKIMHRYQQRGVQPDEPVCVKCRYIIKGITSSTCPECGAELKDGVLRHREPPPFRHWPLVLIGYGLLYTVAIPLLIVPFGQVFPSILWKSERINIGLGSENLTRQRPVSWLFVTYAGPPYDAKLVTVVLTGAAVNAGQRYGMHVLLHADRCALVSDQDAFSHRFERAVMWDDPTMTDDARTLRRYDDSVVQEFARLALEEDSLIVATLIPQVIDAAKTHADPGSYLLRRVRGAQEVGTFYWFYSTPRNLILYTLTMLGLLALWPITILLLRTAAARKQRRRLTVTT